MINTNIRPIKSLTHILQKHSGRNNTGQITVRDQGGRHKRYYRIIDWKRDLFDISGRVVGIEYDPNRNVQIALIQYTNGEKRYILLPLGLKVGDTVISGNSVEALLGNALPMEKIPLGTGVHNIELQKGRGGQVVRAAGSVGIIVAKEGEFIHVKMPSGEVRMLPKQAMATVGQLSNIEFKNIQLGKAGASRHIGVRPHVRGTAQNPRSHPHGGGEGRSGEGMHPKTRTGKAARGHKTRRPKKYSNNLILQRSKK